MLFENVRTKILSELDLLKHWLSTWGTYAPGGKWPSRKGYARSFSKYSKRNADIIINLKQKYLVVSTFSNLSTLSL